jgi:hypothetical protein
MKITIKGFLILFLCFGLTAFCQTSKSKIKNIQKIELINGDIVIIDSNTHVKFSGYPKLALNTMKIEYDGVKIKDNITFFKNIDKNLIKIIKIIPGPNSKIQRLEISTK